MKETVLLRHCSCFPRRRHFRVLCRPIVVAVVGTSLAMEKLIAMKMNELESRPYQRPQTRCSSVAMGRAGV